MRSIYETGPVVAYLWVLPPSNPASLFYYDPASGEHIICRVLRSSGHAHSAAHHPSMQLGGHKNIDLMPADAGSYPASVCSAGNPGNQINHAVVIVGFNRAEKYWIGKLLEAHLLADMLAECMLRPR